MVHWTADLNFDPENSLVLKNNGLVGSMGRVASAADNAAIESFHSLLQKNVLDTRRWETKEELRLAIVTWIERKYHRQRRKRPREMTPVEFEALTWHRKPHETKDRNCELNRQQPQAITQACLFVEDSIRKWASRPPEEVGETLMTSVFGERGPFRLGKTEGERQGWHRLAMGIAMALRNPSGHRISEREDHRTYALGVIGTCSLLLTELKFEHANSFSR